MIDGPLPARAQRASRPSVLAYGIASYALGVSALVAMILCMTGVVDFTGGPVRIDEPLLAALFNLGLAAAFGVQHSAMARAAFKERWVRVIHPSLERSTYVLATGAVLLPVLALWQPLPEVIWSLRAPLLRSAVTGLGVLGWAYLFLATFAIDHFELFGLQQAWRGFRGLAPLQAPFRVRWMYRFDRHPIMTGVLVGMWAAPTMTLGHLLFSLTFTVYVIVGVYFEQRALRRQWGQTFEEYRRRVGSIVPFA